MKLLDVPGQLDLFDPAHAPQSHGHSGIDLVRLRTERQLSSFRGAFVPLAWTWAAHPDPYNDNSVKPSRGDLMEHWRCPSCGGLEISLYDLSKEHGWDPLYDEQPEEGWCYRQVEKNTIACCNGVEAWHNHEYQTVWTEAAGYLPGYAEAHAKGAPLELTGVVWRKVVAIVDGYPCIRHERGTT